MNRMYTNRPTWISLMSAFFGFSLHTYADTEQNDDLVIAEGALVWVEVSGSLNESHLYHTAASYPIVSPRDLNASVITNIESGLKLVLYISDITDGGAVGNYLTDGNSDSVAMSCMAADTFAVDINYANGVGTSSFTTRPINFTISYNTPIFILTIV